MTMELEMHVQLIWNVSHTRSFSFGAQFSLALASQQNFDNEMNRIMMSTRWGCAYGSSEQFHTNSFLFFYAIPREACGVWRGTREENKMFKRRTLNEQKKATTCKRVRIERVKMKSNHKKKNGEKIWKLCKEWRANVANDLINLRCIHRNFTLESSKWLQIKLHIALGWFVGLSLVSNWMLFNLTVSFVRWVCFFFFILFRSPSTLFTLSMTQTQCELPFYITFIRAKRIVCM